MVLYASSDRLDTDWAVKLEDVYPDGRAMLETDLILSARHRLGHRSSNTSIRAKLSKPASAGDYAVKVQPSVKGASAITESAAFAIRKPAPLAVSPASVKAGDTLTISGRFFGITKGKVTIASGKPLPCAVTSWPRTENGGDETIKCKVPKGLSAGAATVTVTNRAGSTALTGQLTVR